MNNKSLIKSSILTTTFLLLFIFLFYQPYSQGINSEIAKSPNNDTNLTINDSTLSNSGNPSETIFPLPKTIFEEPLSYIGTILAILSFLITIFITWVGFFSYFQFKEGRNEIESFHGFKDNAEKEIIEYLAKMENIQKSMSKNKTYLNESVEAIFDSLIKYANIKGDKGSLDLFFRARAISNLYSYSKEEKFAGIGKLGEIGEISDIHLLEELIKNLDEDEETLIDIAKIAITKIKNRNN